MQHSEQSINNILMLKDFIQAMPALFEALAMARSELLFTIRENCHPGNIAPTLNLIKDVINGDVTYQKTPLDLRHQRTYAVKVVPELRKFLQFTNTWQSGVCGLLDVARQTYKEATAEVHQHISEINGKHISITVLSTADCLESNSTCSLRPVMMFPGGIGCGFPRVSLKSAQSQISS